jgi:riboflavin synthase
MFTGLIEEIGHVRAAGRIGDGYRLAIDATTVIGGLKLGDSIAVNGACLTVVAFDATGFSVGLAPETLARTDLGRLRPGDGVNLERAALPTTRLGGHYVQGHIDGTGTIRSFRKDQDSLWVVIDAPRSLMRYIAPKGFIAVDGASLTVVNAGDDWFDLMLIAYSQEKLFLPRKEIGACVNLETDIMAKYAERLLRFNDSDRVVRAPAPPQQAVASRRALEEGVSS